MDTVLNQTQNYHICLKDTVENFTKKLFYALFDKNFRLNNQEVIQSLFLNITEKLKLDNPKDLWISYKEKLSTIRQKLDLDAVVFEETDPACYSLEEVYLAYPGFHAIAVYRLSHELYKMNVPILPRMMSEYAHSMTGIEIHPGATIGELFYIDHGTGIVIGETTVIKDNVKLYQGVTLGGIQIKKEFASVKRHPTIENNVTIYANASVLGGDVVIGKNSIIGANVCIMKSIPEDTLVLYQSENKIVSKKQKK